MADSRNLWLRIQSDASLHNLIRHSGTLYIGGAVSTALTIAQQLAAARLLGAFDYGRFATVLGSSLVIILLIDVRTWELGTKLLARPVLEREHGETSRIVSWLFLVDLVLGALGAALLLAFAQPVATHLLKSAELAALVRLYALAMPFRVVSEGITGAVLRFYERYAWLSVKSVVYALLRLILIGGAALLGFGLRGVLIATVVGEVLNALGMVTMSWLVLKRELPGARLFDLTRPRAFDEGRRMMGQYWISATLKGFHLQSFVPLLALLTTPTQVGLFRVGLDIADSIAKLTAPLSIVLFPEIIKRYEQGARAEFLRFIKQSTLVLALITGPLVVGIIALGPVILPLALGSDYGQLGGVVSPLAIAYGISTTVLWIRPAIVAVGRIRQQNVASAVLAVVSVTALVVVSPALGAVGATVVLSVLIVSHSAWSFAVIYRSLFA